MKTLKLAILSVAIICLFGMVTSSEGFEIVSFQSDTEVWGSYPHTASLTTDVPFYCVWWYVNGAFAGYSYGGNRTTQAYFSPNGLTGSVHGVNHTIKAEVGWIAADGTSHFATDSYVLRMFQSKIISGSKYPFGMVKPKRGTGIYGHVELYRHYHDGQSIVVDASVYASNGTMVELNAASWYRHTQFRIDDGAKLWEEEDPRPSEQLSSGESYNSYGSPMISYRVGGNIKKHQRIKLNEGCA